MKLLSISTLLFAAALLFAPTPSPCWQPRGCGIKPVEIKPIPPPGCKDMSQQCVCDNRGQNCKWGWVCVK